MESPVPGVIPDAVRVHHAPQTWVGGPVNVRERRRWLPGRPLRTRASTASRSKAR